MHHRLRKLGNDEFHVDGILEEEMAAAVHAGRHAMEAIRHDQDVAQIAVSRGRMARIAYGPGRAQPLAAPSPLGYALGRGICAACARLLTAFLCCARIEAELPRGTGR